MPKKSAARSPRGREKSAPRQPSAQQFQSLERRQGELIALQRETLRQLADALQRIGVLEQGRAASELGSMFPPPRPWWRRLLGS